MLIARTDNKLINASNAPVTSALNSTGANFGVGHFAWTQVGGVTTPTFTDSKGNAWNALTTHGGVLSSKFWWSALTSVGSGHTAAITENNVYGTLNFAVYSGVHASPFDDESGSDSSIGGSAASCQPGSKTPSENNCLVLAGIATDVGASGTFSANGGFTLVDGLNYQTGVSEGGGVLELIQTTAAAANPTISWTGTSAWSVSMAIFKAAAAAPPASDSLFAASWTCRRSRVGWTKRSSGLLVKRHSKPITGGVGGKGDVRI